MPQILLGFVIGGLFGVGIMAMMNIASSSDDRLAEFIIEAQHEAIIKLHTALEKLFRKSTGPDWDYYLSQGDEREYLAEIAQLINSITVEEHQNEANS